MTAHPPRKRCDGGGPRSGPKIAAVIPEMRPSQLRYHGREPSEAAEVPRDAFGELVDGGRAHRTSPKHSASLCHAHSEVRPKAPDYLISLYAASKSDQ
jgi:hypothetical protein